MLRYAIIAALLFIAVLVTIELTLNISMGYHPVPGIPVAHFKAHSLME
jgi:hypothetical protein